MNGLNERLKKEYQDYEGIIHSDSIEKAIQWQRDFIKEEVALALKECEVEEKDNCYDWDCCGIEGADFHHDSAYNSSIQAYKEKVKDYLDKL